MRTGLLIPAIAAASAVGAAQQADYFPLHPGNQWMYRGGGTAAGRTVVAEVVRTGEFSGRVYALVRGYAAKEFWLRATEDGRILAYDPEQDSEGLWYDFQAPEGQPYATSLPFCRGRAAVRSRAASRKTPVGEFSNLLDMAYPGVFQVGLEREYFLPYIGLVYREQNTGGPTVAWYELIYARVGGVTVVSAPELSFKLTLDRYSYPPGAVATVRLTLRNTEDRPIRLVFPSSQRFDVVLRNQAGEVVYRWSEGMAFAPAAKQEEVGSGEKNFVALIRLAARDGETLPPGLYTAQAWITTAGREYSAAIPVEIRLAP